MECKFSAIIVIFIGLFFTLAAADEQEILKGYEYIVACHAVLGLEPADAQALSGDNIANLSDKQACFLNCLQMQTKDQPEVQKLLVPADVDTSRCTPDLMKDLIL